MLGASMVGPSRMLYRVTTGRNVTNALWIGTMKDNDVFDGSVLTKSKPWASG